MLFLAATAPQFCSDTASVWGVVGYLVLVLKIVIPLILIVLGMIDLGKAVIASDDKAINKAVTTLLHRFIAAVVIFFIPTIISALFNAFLGFDLNDSGINQCIQCVTNVSAHANDGYCKSGVAINSGYGSAPLQ